MSKKILMPSEGPESWKKLLADPDKQWRTKFSAKTLAHCWEDFENLPSEFEDSLSALGENFTNMEKLFAIPEYQVYLDTKKAPSQNDIFVLTKGQDGLYVLMIEGKVSEPFDKTIDEWLSDNSAGKQRRLDFLTSHLNIKNTDQLGSLRYQLFHRTVSAILTAEKYYAKGAMMIVHSFSQDNEWFDDYQQFVRHVSKEHGINLNPQINKIARDNILPNGIELFFGWLKGDEKYLKK